MSGEPEIVETITALAERGYEGVQVTFSDGTGSISSISWLTVLEDDSPEAAGAIAQTVLRVDPGAKRI